MIQPTLKEETYFWFEFFNNYFNPKKQLFLVEMKEKSFFLCVSIFWLDKDSFILCPIKAQLIAFPTFEQYIGWFFAKTYDVLIKNFVSASFELLISIFLDYNYHIKNFLWTSYKKLWTYFEYVTNVLWTSYELLMNFLWTSYEHLMNSLWTSYELLMNVLWTSYELLMNFL